MYICHAMKLYYLLLSLIIIGGCQSAPQRKEIRNDSTHPFENAITEEQSPKKFHEVITTDLNNDGKMDTITMSGPPLDPGTFQQIEIALNGGDVKTFETDGAWDTIDSSFLKENQNAVNSPLVFVYKDNNQFAILLFGYIYGAGREDFNIIYGKGAHFKMVFDKAFETPMKLQDINHDGQLTLLGREGWVELFGRTTIDSLGPVDIGTYDPFSVLTIDMDTVVMDETATREYNEQKYIWLGPKASESQKIYYPENGGKPVLAK